MKREDLLKTLSCLVHDFVWVAIISFLIIAELTTVKYIFNKAQIHEEQQVVLEENPNIGTLHTVSSPQTHYLTNSELAKLYCCKSDVKHDTCLDITIKDAELLMKIGYAEDRESAESQAGIQKVVLNRMASPLFPNSIEEIIYQKDSNGQYQFSTVANGSFQSAIPDVNSHLALAKVEKGEIDLDALFFEAAWAKDTWQSNNLEYETTIGGTKYYIIP